MVVAELDGDRIVLITNYSQKDLVKQVPGATWDRTTNRWQCRLSWAACLALRGIFGAQLQVGPALTAWATVEYETRVAPCMALRTARSTEELPDFSPGSRAHRVLQELARVEDELAATGLTLYPFQRTGAAFLATGTWAALLDEPGSGKTPQTVVGLRISHAIDGALPALVFCPGAMRHTWKREVERWWPGTRAVVVSGTPLKRRKTLAATDDWDVAVLSWDSARLHSRLAPYGSIALTDKDREPKELNEIEWRSVVADEAHLLRNSTKQTRACWAVGHPRTVAYRVGLTGTPVADTPADAWGLLHFLDPTEHPGRSKYVERYVETSYDWSGYLVYGGLLPPNRDEFIRVTDPRTRRVTKAEALPHLPPLVFEERVVEMEARQAKSYKQMKDDKLAAIDGGLLTSLDGLSVLTRLTQFASSNAELSYDDAQCRHGKVPGSHCEPCGGEALPKEVVTLVEPSCKLDAMEELLEELGPDEPLVVASASRQLLELAEARLAKLGVTWTSVKGGQSAEVRQAAMDAFQGGQVRVILLTIAAGGAGITLTRSKILLFLQKSWDAIQVEQTIHRVHREGSQQHDSVRIIDLVSEGTVEEGQREALAAKGARLQEVVRDAESLAAFVARGGEVKPQRKTTSRACRHRWEPVDDGEACAVCLKPRKPKKPKKTETETVADPGPEGEA